TPAIRSSTHLVEGTATARLVSLVTRHGGTSYLTGLGSKDYLDESLFQEKGVTVEWQEFECPVYPQLHGDFCPMLSGLDYVMMTTSPATNFRQLAQPSNMRA